MAIFLESGNREGVFAITATAPRYKGAAKELIEAVSNESLEGAGNFIIEAAVRGNDGRYHWYSSKVIPIDEIEEDDVIERALGIVEKGQDYSNKSKLSVADVYGPAMRVILMP